MKNTEEKIKNRWENRSLVFGIISILSCMCAMPTSGVPLGIPIGIFAIAFAVISAKGGMRGKAVAGIVTGTFGIVIGLIIYAMILFVVVQLRDKRILNQLRPEQLKVIQDYIQLYITH